VGAVRALALTLPVPVNLDLALPGRPPGPVESAVYFAIAEALANAVKHSGATQVWVSLGYGRGRLSSVVRDNGVGGADAASGTGLRGIGKRLAAFDGTITVTSPRGGPTVVNLELPCELSSPRTSPSFGTG
jgi:signal transduction histidine kinase